MKIAVPHSLYPITRLSFSATDFSLNVDIGDKSQKDCEIELPEGVSEDEVSVSYCYKGQGRGLIDGGVLLIGKSKEEKAREIEQEKAAKAETAAKLKAELDAVKADLKAKADADAKARADKADKAVAEADKPQDESK